MRPLAALIGIVTGSAVSLAVGLTLTWIVLLFLPEHSERFAGERAPLLQAMGLFALMSIVAGASFYAELRGRPWRYIAHLGTVAVISLTSWAYWPR